MAYMLGNQAYIESLQTDVRDLQWTIREIISRVGPLPNHSWKFPDQQACDLDIDDLLDLYSTDTSDEMEDKQVAHIALYELVIDRLVFLLQTTAEFMEMQIHGGKQKHFPELNSVDSSSSSVGIVAKQYWSHLMKSHMFIQQLQSENKSKTNKIVEFEKGSERPHNPSYSRIANLNPTPGTVGIVPPNNADLVSQGASPVPEKKFVHTISEDMSNKSCQTYETAFVPCETCDLIQKKMREGSEVVIKSCIDQGLPCSLKKFKNQVIHVELLTFSDVCRWMAEQNKDIARIAKQNEILQATVKPLKEELKQAEEKVKNFDEKFLSFENKFLEEKENITFRCKHFESKLKETEKQYQQKLEVETKKKESVIVEKENIEKDLFDVRMQLNEQMKDMKNLETGFKVLEIELVEKTREAEKAGQLAEEMIDLKTQLSDVTAQMIGYQKALAKEQGKSRSLSKHNESLQAKQEALLSKMSLLGQNNEEFSSQVADIEEEKLALENKLTELKVETKELKQKLKENKVIIKNLEKEKKKLEKSVKAAQESVSALTSELEEAKQRERLIVEYPDLNGPVNSDLHGSGDIATDMRNQIKANRTRIRLLEEQNESLAQSVKKISNLQNNYKEEPNEFPIKPEPLWHQETFANAGSNIDRMPSLREQHSYSTERPPDSLLKGKSLSIKSRPPSGKLGAVMAPVNATPNGAYTQMKKALGALSVKDLNKKSRVSSGESRNNLSTHTNRNQTLPYSCPQCDKMFTLLRDLEIHKMYCN
ncbi:coiled-coil domain-containing protein 157-like isoform X2 [Physella acuta]|uniref:coiled-coil domain-containing protein 157-like isoform X2 n=1 Tax=Physella acuta TaxID=109671 RepID=UPI0027DBF9ED|nr:coiled-coil domain-containing protein 157-like isoform X2 [Physella acuta]